MELNLNTISSDISIGLQKKHFIMPTTQNYPCGISILRWYQNYKDELFNANHSYDP